MALTKLTVSSTRAKVLLTLSKACSEEDPTAVVGGGPMPRSRLRLSPRPRQCRIRCLLLLNRTRAMDLMMEALLILVILLLRPFLPLDGATSSLLLKEDPKPRLIRHQPKLTVRDQPRRAELMTAVALLSRQTATVKIMLGPLPLPLSRDARGNPKPRPSRYQLNRTMEEMQKMQEMLTADQTKTPLLMPETAKTVTIAILRSLLLPLLSQDADPRIHLAGSQFPQILSHLLAHAPTLVAT